MKQKAVISLSLLFCIMFSASAENTKRDYYFKNIGISQGLSQSSVSCILYDGVSSLWIGTRYGLNEYRNHSIRSFGEDYINFLYTDRSNTLWCGTNQGLYVFDRELDLLQKQNECSSYCAYQSEDGILYFGCRDALLSIADGKQTVFNMNGAMITGIYPWKDKLVLVDKGLGLMSLEKGKIVKEFREEIDASVILASAQKDSLLYLSVFRKGVMELNLDSGQSRFLSNIDSDIILCMSLIGQELWMGTDGQGIFIYDTKSNTIRKQDLPSNSITAIYADPFSNIWAGTVRSGIFGLRPSPILSYDSSNSALGDDVVISLCKEKDSGILWVGSDGGGISLFNTDSKDIVPLSFTRGLKISSLASLGNEKMLVSVYGQGLKIIDSRNKRITPLVIIDESTNRRECYYGNAPQLYKLPNGHILLMAINVYDYNPHNGQFRVYSPQNNIAIAEMKKCSDEFAFTSERLFRIDADNLHLEDLEIDLGGRTINSAAQIGDTLWIGSNSGLMSLCLKDGRLEDVNTGMFSRISYLQAFEDELWIAADNTLFRKNGPKIELMGENKGIAANEILCGLCDEGQYYLGGTTGLIRINRDNIPTQQINQEGQKLLIHSVSMGGRNIQPTNGRIRLPSSFPALQITFGLSMSDPFNRYVYRYIVEGRTDYSLETYDDNLVLHDLKNGRYEIKASFLGMDGNWSPFEKLLEINVLRPWYGQIWFIVLISSILLGSLIYLSIRIYRWKLKKLEQQMRKLNSVFIHKFDSYIEENISNPDLDIKMITENMTMSRASLYNKVKEITGKGIWEYIEDMRMKMACKLLRDSAASITEISEQCGFCSSRYFSTRFKKHFSCTPREYRTRTAKSPENMG